MSDKPSALAPLRRAKIVATLGPATDDLEVLTQMMHAGLDVVRLNASHGTVGGPAPAPGDGARGRAARGPLRRGTAGSRRGRRSASSAFARGACSSPKAPPSRSIPRSIPRPARAAAWASPTRICRAMSLPATRCCSTTGRSSSTWCASARTTVDTRVRVGGELSDRKGLNRQGGGISAPALSGARPRGHPLRRRGGHRLHVAVSFAREAADIGRRARCCAPPAAKRASSPRSSGTRRSRISPASSRRPTSSWWRAAIWGWRWATPSSPGCRRPSFTRRAPATRW